MAWKKAAFDKKIDKEKENDFKDIKEIENEIRMYIEHMRKMADNYIQLISVKEMREVTEAFKQTIRWLKDFSPDDATDRRLPNRSYVQKFECKKRRLEEICTPIIIRIEGLFGSLGRKYLFLLDFDLKFAKEIMDRTSPRSRFGLGPDPKNWRYTPYARPIDSVWRSESISFPVKVDLIDENEITVKNELETFASNLKKTADCLVKEILVVSEKCGNCQFWLQNNSYAQQEKKRERKNQLDAIRKKFLSKMRIAETKLKKM